ncbi:MAG: cation:proton antiporter [Spirochaetaceae bacterium]
MEAIEQLQHWIYQQHIPILVIVGLMTCAGLFFGKFTKYVRLPSIIGFMVVGVLLGPSLLGLLSEELQGRLGFITEIALGFVAVSIGLELKMSILKQQGWGILVIILAEILLAFVLVTGAIYLLTGDLALGLILGAIAPASAPAGTVAIIQEYKARGSLTKALYTVVGFDDGLGIILFGFAAAFSRSIVEQSVSGHSESFLSLMTPPLVEVLVSIAVGVAAAVFFSALARKLKSSRDIFILLFSVVLLSVGISVSLHASLILANMVLGFVVVNTQSKTLLKKMEEELSYVMPLLFVLFFVLAGANLHVAALPSLGLIGLVYVLSRSAGLIGGAALGAAVARAEPKIRKYLGMGILSQAGVAIGLALIVKHEFSSLGTWGAEIGSTVITTVTGTCIFFELIGPIFTKIGLQKAGEIPEAKAQGRPRNAS